MQSNIKCVGFYGEIEEMVQVLQKIVVQSVVSWSKDRKQPDDSSNAQKCYC